MSLKIRKFMEEMHKKVLNIAKSFHRFCEDNDIQYFMMSGTLLGAVRHKGFIPWDDDIDFGMTPENYKRLISLRNKFNESNPDLIMFLPGDKDYFYQFVKIVDKATTIQEKYISSKKYAIGVFIDIFEFCGAGNILESSKELIRRIGKEFKVYYCTVAIKDNLMLVKNAYIKREISFLSLCKKTVLYVMVMIYGKLVGKRKLIQKIKQTREQYNFNESKLVFDPDGMSLRGVIPKEYIESGVQLMDFEGNKFFGLKEYDKYLTHIYKDYMTLPKEEDRVPHHFAYVNLKLPFEEYKKI